MARVLLLSDTHGVVDPRIAALSSECDHVVHAGDIGSGAVLTALRPRGQLVAVRGNNDIAAKWPRGESALLESLPEMAELQLPGGLLVVLHGDRAGGSAARRHLWLRARFGATRAVVYGHSHRLCIDDGQLPWLLNPGAAGRSRTYGGPSCLLLEASAYLWRVESLRFTAG